MENAAYRLCISDFTTRPRCHLAPRNKKNATYNLKVTRPHTDTENPENYKIAPTGRIPAIGDDGFRLIESHPILEYLCDKNGWGDYYPRDAATHLPVPSLAPR